MLEIYEIVWRNKDVTGYLEYNTKTDKFQAYLKDRENPNPRGLFGILKISDVVEDSRVRLYISDCVVPKTRENIDDILECLNKNDACLLVVPVKDTIKVCIDGNIVKTLPREQLVQAQTPQAFKTELIKRCYQKGKDKNYIATDDASLVEYF